MATHTLLEHPFDIEPFRDISRIDGKLSVHAEFPMSEAHGPGRRYTLWLQGCHKRCPGCVNPQMLEVDGKKQTMAAQDVVTRLREAHESVLEVEGITIQGGEPMLQAANLAALIREIKHQCPELTILVFSGYTLQELVSFNSEHINYILSNIDALIDGAFIQERADVDLVRGSDNQHIHHLGQQRLKDKSFFRSGREVIIHPVSGERTVTGVGKRAQK